MNVNVIAKISRLFVIAAALLSLTACMGGY